MPIVRKGVVIEDADRDRRVSRSPERYGFGRSTRYLRGEFCPLDVEAQYGDHGAYVLCIEMVGVEERGVRPDGRDKAFRNRGCRISASHGVANALQRSPVSSGKA